jgi:hypothetical protein
VVNGVNLDKTWCFPLDAGVIRPDRDTVFELIRAFCTAFALHLQLGLVFFEYAINRRGTHIQKLLPDFVRDAEGRPVRDERHLLTEQRG